MSGIDGGIVLLDTKLDSTNLRIVADFLRMPFHQRRLHRLVNAKSITPVVKEIMRHHHYKLSSRDILQIIFESSTKSLREGERLYSIGEENTNLYIILSGRIALHSGSNKTKRQWLYTLGKLDQCGLVPLIHKTAPSPTHDVGEIINVSDPLPKRSLHLWSATADADTVLMCIPVKTFEKKMYAIAKRRHYAAYSAIAASPVLARLPSWTQHYLAVRGVVVHHAANDVVIQQDASTESDFFVIMNGTAGVLREVSAHVYARFWHGIDGENEEGKRPHEDGLKSKVLLVDTLGKGRIFGEEIFSKARLGKRRKKGESGDDTTAYHWSVFCKVPLTTLAISKAEYSRAAQYEGEALMKSLALSGPSDEELLRCMKQDEQWQEYKDSVTRFEAFHRREHAIKDWNHRTGPIRQVEGFKEKKVMDSCQCDKFEYC